jgi:hypothetical protein
MVMGALREPMVFTGSLLEGAVAAVFVEAVFVLAGAEVAFADPWPGVLNGIATTPTARAHEMRLIPILRTLLSSSPLERKAF